MGQKSDWEKYYKNMSKAIDNLDEYYDKESIEEDVDKEDLKKLEEEKKKTKKRKK